MLPFSVTDTASSVAQDGFARISAPAIDAAVAQDTAAWAVFGRSWDDLPLDPHMGDGGRYRLRRHAVFAAAPGQTDPIRQPHQPHWQSRDYNALNGGIERWFEPVTEAVGQSPLLASLLRLGRHLCDRLVPLVPWHIEMHQFRILAAAEKAGQPTPEGIHHDGVDYVLIQLLRRSNVVGGETVVLDNASRELARFTLSDPGEAIFLDDKRVRHGVTPLLPADPAQPGHRDVLVLTYRRA